MDKRLEPRVPLDIRFFVHVHECEVDPTMVGVSVTCVAVDFSVKGLQFKTDTKLPPHSLLNITIGIGEPFKMFLLRGEIRWVRGSDEEYFMGILLKDVPGTDLKTWTNDFASIFEAGDDGDE